MTNNEKEVKIPMWYTKYEGPYPVWLMKDFHLFNACRLIMLHIDTVQKGGPSIFDSWGDEWVESVFTDDLNRTRELKRLNKIKQMLVDELQFRRVEIPNIHAVPTFPPELVGCGA